MTHWLKLYIGIFNFFFFLKRIGSYTETIDFLYGSFAFGKKRNKMLSEKCKHGIYIRTVVILNYSIEWNKSGSHYQRVRNWRQRVRHGIIHGFLGWRQRNNDLCLNGSGLTVWICESVNLWIFESVNLWIFESLNCSSLWVHGFSFRRCQIFSFV